MSYVVCHVKKFKSNDVKGMQIHNQRESENSINKDIDSSRTNLNYDLHNQNQINYNKRVKEILEEGYKGNRAIRKDATVMTGTIVSSDREFFNRLNSEQTKLFFETSYNYFKNFYGEKNIIAAQVHLDETTPHMHIMAVPLKEDGRLSAKTMITRESLRRFQSELPKLLQEKGFEINRGIENSKANHKETIELKKDTFEDTKAKIEEYNKLAEIATQRFNSLKDTITLVENIKPKKRLLGSNLSISEEDYATLKTKAEVSELYAIENKDIKKEICDLKSKLLNLNERIKESEKRNEIFQNTNKSLEIENETLKFNSKLILEHLKNLSISLEFIDKFKIGNIVEFKDFKANKNYGIITGYKDDKVIINKLSDTKRSITSINIDEVENSYIDLSKNYIINKNDIEKNLKSLNQESINKIQQQKELFYKMKFNKDVTQEMKFKKKHGIQYER